jgi:hypothetical protein
MLAAWHTGTIGGCEAPRGRHTDDLCEPHFEVIREFKLYLWHLRPCGLPANVEQHRRRLAAAAGDN